MRLTARRIGVTGVLACVALFGATAASATAAPKPITGKLTKGGLTVIALARSGEAASKVAKRNGKFKLKAPAKKVTLHLRARDGTYAGPVVIAKRGKKGKTAILGVNAPANLGKVQVRKGYAKLRREPPRRNVDRKRRAKAKRGVPIGARRFGRVRSRASGPAGPGLDQDRDGIPGSLDIDDDGDLVLDNVDRATPTEARVARRGGSDFNVRSVLAVPLWETANANAATLTQGDIDTALTTWGRQIFEVLPGDLAELDCGGEPDPNNPNGWIGGLIYCVRGGTGAVVGSPAPPSQWSAFPECCDQDDDGFGALAPGSFFLAHGATSAQIGTGDVLIQRVTTGGIESEFPVMLPFVFATSPALVSYNDGQGNAATVTYPVADPIPGPNPGPGGPGTDDDPFPVKAGTGGEVVVTLMFFRPQRRPIPPEPGTWTDMGGLTYAAAPAVPQPVGCPQSAFSTTDTNLTPAAPPVPYAPNAGGLVDLAPDQPASPGNMLTYSLNLTQCLAAGGVTWNAGEAMSFNFGAVDAVDGNVSVTETVPGVTFELQP
jgi:hypothetical protein